MPAGSVTDRHFVGIVLDGAALDGSGVYQTLLGAADCGPYLTARFINGISAHDMAVSTDTGGTLTNLVMLTTPTLVTLAWVTGPTFTPKAATSGTS